MALNHSPKIVTDGLVFAYDMANTKKSWKGRPITNQFAIPTPDANGYVGFQVNGTGTFRRIFSGNYGGYDIEPNDIVYRYDLGSTGCHYHGNDVTINAGQTATWSFDYYVDPSVTGYPSTNYLANFEGVIGGSAGDPTPTQIGVWKRITFTGTAGSTGMCRMLLYPGACGDRLATGGFVLFKNPQVEFDAPGNNPSPFVAGTRSNTQALIDLTGNKTITAVSPTYYSDNTFKFKGAGQRLDTNLTTFGNNATWEAWIKCDGSVTPYNMFMGRMLPYFGFYDGNSLYFSNYIGAAQQSIRTTTNLTSNTWYHATFTTSYDGVNTTMKIYTNGVETATGTFAGAQGYDGSYSFSVGDGQNASWYRFDGQVPVVKVYNRALSAAEVKQNFNALRGRYGL